MESNTSVYEPYENEVLLNFQSWYSGVHGYLSLMVCIFGIPMNLINVTVLTQKHMRTPINCILTWLAVSDMLTMMSYVPFATQFYCVYPPWEVSAKKNSLAWMTFMLFHINFSSTTHTVSIWLGVTLAIVRYKHIYSPATGAITRIRRLVRARIAIVAITVVSVLGMIPNYLTNKLVSALDGNNQTYYSFEDMQIGTPHTKTVVYVNLWMYSVLAKILPCILMVIYGGLLVWTLKLKLKRRRLSCSTSHPARPQDNSRTTRMLLIVIVLFLVTEFPQGILIILSVTSQGFFRYVYIPLGDLMDMVALINSGVNFVLYCAMSRDFRLTLMCLLRIVPKSEVKQPITSGIIFTDSERSQTALLRMT